VDTALSAIRNLHNYDIGGRKLRVAYAENEGAASSASGGPASSNAPYGAGASQAGDAQAHRTFNTKTHFLPPKF